jgi:hypothetical protein
MSFGQQQMVMTRLYSYIINSIKQVGMWLLSARSTPCSKPGTLCRTLPAGS